MNNKIKDDVLDIKNKAVNQIIVESNIKTDILNMINRVFDEMFTDDVIEFDIMHRPILYLNIGSSPTNINVDSIKRINKEKMLFVSENYTIPFDVLSLSNLVRVLGEIYKLI